jgi:simple sugar transport system ATP-binding protein
MTETAGGRIEPRLRLLGISKAYPLVVANADVDLTVMPGEIHAVLGENGAGKSTLMKIIYGVIQPDRGQILWEGRQVEIASPSAARKLGIGMVFQHFSLFETLTVAENISLVLEDKATPAMLAPRIRSIAAAYGLPVDPDRLVHSMSVGERQRVEIVRCLLQSPRLLIMDEPTSVLTPQAVLKLFDSLRSLAAEGCSILYISHKLDEIQALCDRATVLRSGRVTGTANPRQETAGSLAQLMIGRELPACILGPGRAGAPRLALNGLTLETADPFGTQLKDLRLQVHGGEIVGIAGISGNGQQELLRALSGEARTNAPGALQLMGRDAGHLAPAARRRLGLGFVPEERLGRGAVPDLSLSENALLTGYGAGMVARGLIRFRRVRDFARQVIDRFQVKCGGERSAAGSLSGGNLQKFIVGREAMLQPQVLVVAQPTWGVDIGASMLIRQALIDLRDQGMAILVLSEELDELFMMSDRLAVLANGRLSPAVATRATNVDQIGAWMSGNFEAAAQADPGALAEA